VSKRGKLPLEDPRWLPLRRALEYCRRRIGSEFFAPLEMQQEFAAGRIRTAARYLDENATPDIKSGAAYARVLERTYPDMEEKGAAIQFLQEGAASFDDLCLAARSRKKMGATIATALAVRGRHRAA
jgi:hypothetical protein